MAQSHPLILFVLFLDPIQRFPAQAQQVLLAQRVLQEARVEIDHILQGVVGVDGHAERLGGDKPADAFRARRGGEGAGIGVEGQGGECGG